MKSKKNLLKFFKGIGIAIALPVAVLIIMEILIGLFADGAAMELFLVEKPPVATVEKLWLSASNQSMPAMYSSTVSTIVIRQ